MDESDFDYENFEEISLMGDIVDKIEANDVWNETINEMIRRGDAVRRSDGKVIFSDQVPDFDIVEDIASYTQSDIKSAEGKVLEAPLVGAGATMDITKDSSLSSFTPEELTGSSAIHGDFDHASLNYSGHQNIEARAEWDYAHDSGATVPKYYQDDEELPIYKYFMDSATAPYHIHGLDTFYMPEGKDYYWNKIKEKFMPADYRPDESEEWRDIHWQEEADWDAILNEEFVDELYEKWLANHEYNAVAKIAENDPDWAIQNEARLEAVGYFAESSIQKAEETFGLVQPNFWMNYPITGMLATIGLFAIGKTLLNSRKEEM